MNSLLKATRLTLAGRLTEATTVLQNALQGETTPDGASRPPDAGRAPPQRERLRSGGAATGRVAPQLPEALLGLLDRVARIRSEPEARSWAKRSGKPASAPAPAQFPGQFIQGTYANPAGSRAYKLYIPSGYRGQALPLVVMLHGCTQSPDDFAAGTRMNALAEEQNCLVVYPAQPASANPSKCWNWFSPSDQRRGQGEPSLIEGITRQVMAEYAVDLQRVYVAGLSAGAAAAAIMVETYPDLYAAACVHSGLACGAARDVASAFTAMRQGGSRSSLASRPAGERYITPVIVFHGDKDTTVHPSNGDQVIAQSMETATTQLQARTRQGRVPDGHAYSRTLHRDAEGRVILEQWVVHGGGHAWFGGSPAGSYTDPNGPDASREMLRFFLEHPHPPVAGTA
jgi:poly(hydroxyalkanoate) depolymerase family esterase